MSHTRTIATAFIAAASVALAACAAPNAAPRSASPIAITPETGSEVAKYLRLVRSTLRLRPAADRLGLAMVVTGVRHFRH